jgi:hypothetical protein
MKHAATTLTTRIGICLHAYVLEQFDTAGRSLGRSRERLHSGIHEARKSIRRIRAALDLGREKLWPDSVVLFDELKNLCRGLSLVRDAHAVVETLDRLFKQTKDAEIRLALRAIRKKLVTRRALRLTRSLKQDPGFRRYRTRLRSLRDCTESLQWGVIDAAAIRCALARGERRALRAERRARVTRRGPLRHRWRRRLRRLRHQMMILESALNWRFIDAASPDAREAISIPEWSAAVGETIDSLEHKADALAFEHDLRLLQTALRTTSGIKDSDRDKTLKLVRRKIGQASRR